MGFTPAEIAAAMPANFGTQARRMEDIARWMTQLPPSVVASLRPVVADATAKADAAQSAATAAAAVDATAKAGAAEAAATATAAADAQVKADTAKQAAIDAAAADTAAKVGAINDKLALPIDDSRFTEDSLTVWPFQAGTIPTGALGAGSVVSGDIADFTITALKFNDNRHHIF